MAVTTRAAAATAAKVMEKPTQEQIQQQQHPLKCPRCESTNTKFCYYNNYSLSQPRHFCKACKRYWTRGGTLRNVPVGGGCRKNKRVKKPSSNSSATSSGNINSATINESNTFSSQSLNPSGVGGGNLINHMLHGLPINLAPPSSSSHEVISNGFSFCGFDKYHGQHQMGGLGLGFSSAGILGGGDNGVYRNGFSTPKQILQDLISNSNPSSLVSTFNESCNTTTVASTTTPATILPPTMSMSSLLTSTFQQQQQQQQKFNFHHLLPYQLDLQKNGVGSHGNEGLCMKLDHVKLENDDHHHHEQCQILSGYQIHDHHQQQQQQPMGASDPSILWNDINSTGNSIGGNWLDPSYSSIGSSSVPSLI